jgi:UDP-N-acetyl-D-glucosamine dehydrogenase
MGVLAEKGAILSYSDPYVPILPPSAWPGHIELRSRDLSLEMLDDVDCVAILTDHKAFDYQELVRKATLVVDTRNAIKSGHDNVFRLGAPSSQSAVTKRSKQESKVA